jgi:altronate dehydratase large subunit
MFRVKGCVATLAMGWLGTLELAMAVDTLSGYRRPDGAFGIRNHVLILPTVVCANSVIERLDRAGSDEAMLTHQHGCGQVGDDLAVTQQVLLGMATNPNVGAVVLVSLGCESNAPNTLAERLAVAGREVEIVSIQADGGISRASTHVAESVARMRADLDRQSVVEAGWEELMVGLECGGSDGWSGITANPALGRAADWLVARGATVVLGETPEIVGAEHLLARRAISRDVGDDLLDAVGEWEEKIRATGANARGGQPSPGNIDGGITTIEEKSLGAIQKGGTQPLQEVVGYGTRPSRRGLVFMDTPGQDIEQLTGLAAGGCQLVCFTTGRGTPTGSPVMPVIKIATNSSVAQLMDDHIDVDTGRVAQGSATLDEVAQDIVTEVVKVCAGKRTASERNRQRDFALPRLWGSL